MYATPQCTINNITLKIFNLGTHSDVASFFVVESKTNCYYIHTYISCRVERYEISAPFCQLDEEDRRTGPTIRDIIT